MKFREKPFWREKGRGEGEGQETACVLVNREIDSNHIELHKQTLTNDLNFQI